MKTFVEAVGSTIALRDAGLIFALMGRPPSIWSVRPDGSELTKVISDCGTPDGIAVDLARGHIYWTNMGEDYGANDGFIERINLDGTNRAIIVPKGSTFTPKQLVFDADEDLLYWSDREGVRVMRARLDGSDLTVLIQTGSSPAHRADETRHCVGIALDRSNGHIYWSQKGPTKSGKGRIFRAGIELPPDTNADSRQDIETLLEHLPEPIDLKIDHEAGFLYWTDRGNPPDGNTLNRATIGPDGCSDHRIIARDLHEGIGLALDVPGHRIFTSDLGGYIREISLEDFSDINVIAPGGPLTGIAYAEIL